MLKGAPEGTDRQIVAGAGEAWVAGCLGAGEGPVPCWYCSVTLPVSAGGSVHQTLNIQRADCGRGKAALWQAGSAWGREGLGVVCRHLGLGT